MMQYFGAIEAGGTKFNCAIFNDAREILAACRIPTTHPQTTLHQAAAFFQTYKHDYPLAALGIASFGPLDLDPKSSEYGYITRTPKPDWSHTPLLDFFKQQCGCPIRIDTDVNGAALAEYQWGAAQHTDVAVYLTIGTGVGGGIIINGKPLHGLVHPEIGHMLVDAPPDVEGVCPFHGNCVEGLASGFALNHIWQQPAETLPIEHKAWQIEVGVLSQLCHNLMMTLSPQKILMGGGVMAKTGLLERVQAATDSSLAKYISLPSHQHISDIICSPYFEQDAGLYGGFALAQSALVNL
ncbi:ROK family protein [Aestuariibacter sp. AA17]|uniref:fructokinase n=1 Tax=Fluctibacter corallii TaxID=2984329 RepID=A0ABT3ACA7_9ALTE|nr:ROK family protein [Aestuariibacter sp. AA17]MCV2886309.1 ROK family protein [Aestuariibacter sp. AA17]